MSIIRVSLFTAFVMAIAVPGFAGDEAAASDFTSSAAEKVQNALLKSTYVMTFTVQAYDASTTLDALHSGARELDPLMRPFTGNATVFVVANLARAAAVDVGIRAIATRHKVLAIVVGAAINSAYLTIAIHNHNVAEFMRRGSQ